MKTTKTKRVYTELVALIDGINKYCVHTGHCKDCVLYQKSGKHICTKEILYELEGDYLHRLAIMERRKQPIE
jgi:hypothetical protein